MAAEPIDYATHSAFSDPGPYGTLFGQGVGNGQDALRFGHNVILHFCFGEELIPPLPAERREDRRCRRLSDMLARIVTADPGPLDRERAERDRFSGSCRDYALLTCAALRQRGLPARLRVGFAGYFTTGFWVDHWLCEAWDSAQRRWRLLDAELDAERRARFAIDFDPADVPRDRFLTAGQVWQALREGRLDGQSIGVYGTGIRGAWFAGGSLLRDLAALNKLELQPWDYWGVGVEFSKSMNVAKARQPLLDEIAEAIATGEPNPSGLQALGRRPQLRVPDRVLCYPYGEPEEAAIL